MQLMLYFGDPLDPVWGRHDLLATGVTQLLVNFYNLIADESQFLTAAAKLRIAEIGDQLTKVYAELAMMCCDWEIKLRKLSPELHFLSILPWIKR